MKATPAALTVLRSLGFAAACSIAISNMIGQGVFLKARVMTCNVGSPALMLAAWFVAGVLSLCGALTLGELGAALPESGGIYAFLRRAYGGAIAFAYGWMTLFIASPASIAALAAGAAIFFNLFSGQLLDGYSFTTSIGGFRLGVTGVQLGAIALIVVMTAINCAPAVVNGGIATWLAGLKIAMLVAVPLAAFGLGYGHFAHFTQSGAGGACHAVDAAVRGGASGFAAALVGALYAYQGWHSLTLIAGEVKQPGRNLPFALIISVMLVIALYVAANASFVYVLSPAAIASLAPGASVGVTVVERLFGPLWQTFAAVFLFVSVAATLHVTILTNARVTYAIAKDRLGFDFLGRLSLNGRVPVNAVIANGLLAAGTVIAGTFDTLSDYLVFNIWVFFVLTGIAMFVLRRREPSLPRPYHTFGYPLVPVIYVGVGTWLLVQTALSSPVASAIGLVIVGLSFPVYAWRRR